jgi:hypothetical protein
MAFTFVIQKERTGTGCQNSVVIIGEAESCYPKWRVIQKHYGIFNNIAGVISSLTVFRPFFLFI